MQQSEKEALISIMCVHITPNNIYYISYYYSSTFSLMIYTFSVMHMVYIPQSYLLLATLNI